MNEDLSPDLRALIHFATPFARCLCRWDQRGYGRIYCCLDREVDIADPEHQTRTWAGGVGPCQGCELRRVLDRITGTKTRYGTEPRIAKISQFPY
jgi:hypothetical protein